MDEHCAQLQEITGFSTLTLADAIRNALVRAAQTVPPTQVQWVEKGETREMVDESGVVGWQVTLLIGVMVEDTPHHRIRGCAPIRSYLNSGCESDNST